jgi:glycosyltransferase involved in cell wall biosynthesis
MAMIAAKLAGIRAFVRDEPTSISTVRSATKAQMKRILFFGPLRALCDGFLAIGTLNREYYLANDVDPARIFSVPYCVDNAYFARLGADAAASREALRASLDLTPGRPIILYAAKFERRKRADDLLRAFSLVFERAEAHRKPYLLLIGDGEMAAALKEQARPHATDIRFLGFRNQSELPAFFDLCDVFVLPSHREPWGLIVNEVMSVGRAVIVSDQVGCGPDLVQDGVNGYVFPFGDVDALADVLEKVLRSDENIRAMGRASAEFMKGWDFQRDLDGLRTAIASTVGSQRTGR